MLESGWGSLAHRVDGLEGFEGRVDHIGNIFEWHGIDTSWGTNSFRFTEALRHDTLHTLVPTMDVGRYGKCPTYKVDWNVYSRAIIDALILEAEDRSGSAALPAATFDEDNAEDGPTDGDAGVLRDG